MLGLLTNQQFQIGLIAIAGALLATFLGATPQEVVGVEGVLGALFLSTLIEGDIRGLASRRVLTALLALIGVIVMGRLGAPESIWIPVQAVFAALINAYAIRDVVDPDSMRNSPMGAA